jgi:hypothetical protein
MEQTKIVIGRLDNNKRVEVVEGMSISSVLRINGFVKAENEEIQDIAGNKYEGHEEVISGTGYFLIQRVKSGNY